MRDPALAARLAAFSIDEGAPALSFAARLARENRWSLTQARRVVAEYFRFIYLASVSRDTLTPSVAIDQAWHLHLCYTRSYWHHLCREVLGRELHHGPTRGGSAENTRYHDCYERTLALYAEEFGAAPPTDIWPPAERRFAPDSSPVSVAPAEHLILSKTRLRRGLGLAALLPLITLCLGAVVKTAHVLAALLVAFFLVLLVIVVRALIRAVSGPGTRRRDRRSGGCSATGCGVSTGCGHSAGRHDSGSDSGDSGSSSDSGCGSGCGGGCGGGD